MKMFRIEVDRNVSKKYEGRFGNFALFLNNIYVVTEAISKENIVQRVFVVACEGIPRAKTLRTLTQREVGQTVTCKGDAIPTQNLVGPKYM